MINIDKVMAVLCSLSGKTMDELGAYLLIVKNAVSVISSLVSPELHDDDRTIYLAGAKANYDISLASVSDGVTSFSAGDVSISQTSNAKDYAKVILDDAMKNCASIINDNGFAFMGV